VKEQTRARREMETAAAFAFQFQEMLRFWRIICCRLWLPNTQLHRCACVARSTMERVTNRALQSTGNLRRLTGSVGKAWNL